MTYRFKCSETGDVLMLREDGDAVLRIMGRHFSTTGLIHASALNDAIASVEWAVAEAEAKPARSVVAIGAENGCLPQEAVIGLRQRTWPLLRMLKAAKVSGVDVIWTA